LRQPTASLILGILCAAQIGVTASAAAVFTDEFSAEFALEARGMIVGRTLWTLTREGGDRVVYESESKPTGFASLVLDDHIVERSEWRLEDGELRPAAYRYDRSGRKEREVAVAFDWKRGLTENTSGGETWHMPIEPGTLDKLGYLFAMMHDLARGERELSYTITDGRKLKTYRLRAVGTEILETDLGRLETLEVRRVREDNRRETTFWCAPRYRFLPVKVEHREKDGSVIRLYLRSVAGLGEAASL